MPTAETTLPTLEAAERVYARLLPEMEALKDDELRIVNADPMVSASIAMSAAPRIAPLTAEITRVIPSFPVILITSLVDRAQLLWYVHVTSTPVAPGGTTEEIVNEASQLRSRLILWATPLAAEGHIDATAFEQIRAGSGHKDLASDIVALVALLRGQWDTVKTLVPITEPELDRGAQLASTLWAITSLRENPAPAAASPAETTLRLRRAWTLLDRAYSECRRAVQFVRFHEGDADLIAPSLRRHATRPTKTQPTPAPEPAAPPATPTAPGLGGTSSPFVTP